jgi:flagellin
MALTINTNVSSLFAQQYLSQNQQGLSDTLLRLSSGLRINNASDDPAGLAIAQNMQQNIGGLSQGSRNGQTGVDMVQTAQGAMQTILSDLQLMNQLAVQASSGTNSAGNLSNLNTEFQALLTEIGRVASTTNFNGVSVLGGGSISIQIGDAAGAGNQITVNLTNTSTGSAGLNIASSKLYDGSTDANTDALAAITSLGAAISSVTTGLATLGADSANLQAAIQSNDTYTTNLSSAKSSILDADYAAESSNLAKFNILNQSDVAMLSQANSAPSLVLQLLRQ